MRTPAVILKLFHHCGLGAARTLGRLGVPVFGVHDNPRDPVARSRYLTEVLEWDLDRSPAEDSVEFLLHLATRIGDRPVLIPTDDVGAMLVDDHAEDLRSAYRFPAQPRGLGRRLHDKKDMHLICRRIGIPTPDVVLPKGSEDILRYAETGTFPVVLKITTKEVEDEVSVEIARNPTELLAHYERMQRGNGANVMVQEYIPGGDDSVWMFNGYFNADSAPIFGFTGQKLRQWPAHRGMTTLGVAVPNAEVSRLTHEFMMAVGYRGILDIGWRFDARDGGYKVLDVNPRLGATFRLFVDPSDLDVLRCMYLDLTGQPTPRAGECAGRKWIAEDLDLLSSLEYRRAGDLTARSWLMSLAGVQEVAWFARDDPRPFAARLARGFLRVRERLRRRLSVGRTRSRAT